MAPKKLPKKLEPLLTKPATFTSKRNNNEFIISINEDSHIFGEETSKKGKTKDKIYIISVQKINQEKSKPTYVVAMLTGFAIDKKGKVIVNFLSVFKYKKLYRHIIKYIDRDENSQKPILDDLEYYIKNGITKSNPMYYEHLESIFKRPELPEQINFLFNHLKNYYSKNGKNLSDAKFKKYMNSKEARGREFSGMAIELIHYIVDKLPKGTIIEFELAHIKADQSMIEGNSWADTNFGKVVLRETGTELYKTELKDYHQTISLIKK
jgi:hypothetical protein